MNCEKVRELLLTDHTDGELDADTAAAVRGHLARCASCKAFETTILRVAVEPFRAAVPVAPPQHVWKRIERAIGTRQPSRASFAFPKPVFVMATVTMLVVAAAFFVRTQDAERRSLARYVAEEMSFLSPAFDGDAAVSDEDLYGLGSEPGTLSRRGNSAASSVV